MPPRRLPAAQAPAQPPADNVAVPELDVRSEPEDTGDAGDTDDADAYYDLDEANRRFEGLVVLVEDLTERLDTSHSKTDELITLVRQLLSNQGVMADRELERQQKCVERELPELEDEPGFLEHWIARATRLTERMDDYHAVTAVQRKLAGSKVHGLAMIKYNTPAALFEDLTHLLSPDMARAELHAEIVTSRRYSSFSPSDGIDQAKLDMAFLKQGTPRHQLAMEEVLKALLEIFPMEYRRSVGTELPFDDAIKSLRAQINRERLSTTYNGWADKVPPRPVAASVAVDAQPKLQAAANKGHWQNRRAKQKNKSAATAAPIVIDGSPNDDLSAGADF
ncbi:hypothetical protein IWW50_003932 [Coemansia erecta]|nr:hypothetical protein IWW50_003932 [Coemansia erecta]